MPRHNRVTPFGEIVAEPWRGLLMGNRGCLHDDAGRIGARHWRHRNWVCCLTDFRDRKRPLAPPGRWTALFFWDEATALAAGHRPCGACRRSDYRRFMACWRAAGLRGEGPREVDKALHAARVGRDGSQVRFEADAAALPCGTLVDWHGTAALVMRGRLHALDPADGYRPAVPAAGRLTVLTPEPIVAVLGEGYAPRLLGFDRGVRGAPSQTSVGRFSSRAMPRAWKPPST